METFLENKYPTTKGSGFNGKFKSSLKDKARDDLEYMADILNIGSHWENPFPALDYSSFESFEKLTDDYLEYIKLMDIFSSLSYKCENEIFQHLFHQIFQ